MSNIGEKIREIRKRKGMSQETLAELSKLNLRTIQRIEKNESEAHGKTLKLISEALEIDVENILDYRKQVDNNYLVIFHLSVLVFIVIPTGNIILPLILWLTKKDKISNLDEIGKNLLNFQIVWSIISSLSIIVYGLTKILHIYSFNVLLFLFIILYVINIALPIFFAIKQRKGVLKYKYPNIIKFIK